MSSWLGHAFLPLRLAFAAWPWARPCSSSRRPCWPWRRRRCRRACRSSWAVAGGALASTFGALGAGAGLGAPGACGTAFSSPGRRYSGAFPRHQEVEVAEVLRQLDRLIDDALLGLGIAQLDIAGLREVLAQRIALEPIVGEDAAKVGIAGESHAVHVEHLALEPAGDRPQPGHARHRRILVGRDLEADAVVLGHRQQVIIDLEPLGPLGIVDPGDLHQLLIAELVAGDARRPRPARRASTVKVSSSTCSREATNASPIAAR